MKQMVDGLVKWGLVDNTPNQHCQLCLHSSLSFIHSAGVTIRLINIVPPFFSILSRFHPFCWCYSNCFYIFFYIVFASHLWSFSHSISFYLFYHCVHWYSF
uniref:Uncharacterized protein n=1 Tax=Cacopsylla melanoneura TaxID=428564 RepID=A0A8D8R0S2_9HEMI